MSDRHRDVALFRYSLIRPAADEALTTRERGRLVRQLAAQDHHVRACCAFSSCCAS